MTMAHPAQHVGVLPLRRDDAALDEELDLSEVELDELIRRDQLAGVRRSLATAIPANLFLSGATLAVAAENGMAALALPWFAVATAINLVRHLLLRRNAGNAGLGASLQLRWASYFAFLSGLLWAATPLLSLQALGPDAVFHLIVGAGLAGGATAMGVAYAPIVIFFITPILIAHAGALFLAGGFEQTFLAGTVVLYLLALCRSAIRSQEVFRGMTRLKHKATILARSLREAHARSVAVASEMSHRALHDPLTGLLNRDGFLLELDRRAAVPGEGCCVLLLDLDGFKAINDAFGHKVGDRVLVEVAGRMRGNLPLEAALARLGGDEFAVVLDTAEAGASPVVAARLVAAIGAPFAFDAGRLGVSIGIYDGAWRSTADVLVYADAALYEAKSSGRNRYCLFDETLRTRLEIRRDSERDLLPGLASGALEVWYQPIFSEGGRRLASVEALLRWRHPRHGWISPQEIVIAAALGGHAEHLFGFIIDQACGMALRLRGCGRPDVAVAVNVSPREMSQLPVDVLLLGRLRAAGLPPSAIEIEVTEETALDVRAVQSKLAGLAMAGIRIAVDDFGVGYSSLATLRQLHADRIKIDRSFVTGLSASADNRLLLQAVVSLGRAMKLDVVAEGVESSQDVVILRAMGCQFMQGYYLGRPMPAENVLKIVGESQNAEAATAA
jgi:diguanylate cyclase (GGDEF)-like protein